MPISVSVLLATSLLMAAPEAPAAAPAQPAAQPAAAAPKHDRDPWVFRCVLDNNPRMLVISLGDRWWMAFDTVHCSVYQLWHGDIELTGAVYDTKHGPQPKAKGRLVLDGKSPIRFHVGKEDSATQWAGYQLNGDHVTLNWKQGDVTFSLTPTHDGETLKLAVEHSSVNEQTDFRLALPGWLAQVPGTIEPTVERNPAESSEKTTQLSLPKSGPLTLKIDLTTADDKTEEPTK